MMSGPSPVSMGLPSLPSHRPHGHFSHAVGPHRTPPGLGLCGSESLQKYVHSLTLPSDGGRGTEAFREVWRYKPCSSACSPAVPSPQLGLALPGYFCMLLSSQDCPSNIPECSLGAQPTPSSLAFLITSSVTLGKFLRLSSSCPPSAFIPPPPSPFPGNPGVHADFVSFNGQ